MIGWAFVALAVVVGVIELWPIVEAISIGATAWPGDLPQLLPNVARAAAMVILPAAVAWASPTRHRANAWLWKGALLVALVQVVRYPAEFARDAVLSALLAGGADLGEPVLMLVNVGVGLGLALLAVLGVWALSEGIKDAGGRSTVAVVFATLVAVALGLLLVVPAFMAGAVLDLRLVPDLLSVLVNMLFVFANALLAGRCVAGALRGARPVAAWRAGAIGGVVLFLVPVLSLAVLLANAYLLGQDSPMSIPFMGVATYFGWPLLALALGMGMGRLAAPAPRLVGSGFVMRGRARHIPAATT
ncbi:MAG TPA: hypothetical protein VGK16_04850 [Candidatus Limnocylindrales bacterium]